MNFLIFLFTVLLFNISICCADDSKHRIIKKERAHHHTQQKKDQALLDNTMPGSLLHSYYLAIQNNAELSKARATYHADAQKMPQARALLFPQITASINTQSNQNNAVNALPEYGNKKNKWNSHDWSANLNQTFFDFSKWLTLDAVYLQDKISYLTLAMAEQQIIYDVADKYFAVLKALSNAASAQANLKAVQKQLYQTEERFKVGIVANTDIQEAKASYDTSKVLVIEAENEITIAKENLSLLTNSMIDDPHHLNQKMLVTLPQPSDITLWEKKALQQNLLVLQNKLLEKLAHKGVHIARAGHLPTLSGSLSYQQAVSHATHQTNNMAGNKQHNFIAGFSVNIPLFSGGLTLAKTMEATYNFEASQHNYEQSQRQIRISTRNSFNSVNSNALAINAWCQGIKSALSSLKATQSGYEVGTRTVIDVLNSQSALFNAQKQYIASRYDFILNTLKLKQIAGTLNINDLIELDKWMAPTKDLPLSLTPYCLPNDDRNKESGESENR